MRHLILLLCTACSSNVEQVNACPTLGPSYLQQSIQTSGNCGDMPNMIVNVNNDGTITFTSNISCQHIEKDGCTIRSNDCSFANNGISCTETYEAVFTSDGGSASGTITLFCTELNQSCTSTYSFTMTRE